MESRAPLRTCIGCRRKDQQGTFLRITRNPSGELSLSQGRIRHGRGVYICPNIDCVASALKGQRLAKALRTKVTDAEKESLELALHAAT